MTVRYTVLNVRGALINQAQMKPIFNNLLRAVTNAHAVVTARGPAFGRWFGGFAARRDIVLNKMTTFMNFLNGHNSLTIQPKAFNPTALDYAHTYQIAHDRVGQWIIYLGPHFNAAPSPWAAANMAHPGTPGHQLKVLAHEISHAILDTNKPTRFYDEHYQADALTLAGVDPEYAAWNADNYGFFIEACS